MTKETKLRASLDRQIAKGSPKAYKTLAKLLRMNESVCEAHDPVVFGGISRQPSPLWDSPSMKATQDNMSVMRRDGDVRWTRRNEEIPAPVETSGPILQNPNSFTVREYINRNENLQKAVDEAGFISSGLAAMARRDQCGRE